MFPSLAALGGTLGLLGLREPELMGSADIGSLNRGFQRHIDSCPVDYAALMRDPSSGMADTPIAKLAGAPRPETTVALIGGGIANIIAAYELSRIGIRCTVYEASGQLGGRLSSYREKDSSTAWSERGAVRFPRGGLMWHYVAQWVRSAGLDPVTGGIQANSFPSAGTVPTMLAYQGRTYRWSPGFEDLPPIVGEARARFADFVAGLNNGSPDPYTVYFADAVRALKTEPDIEDNALLDGFWAAMIEQYDGRSCAEVLRTEVFASGSNPTDLMAAFDTVGVGTGGFRHFYDASFLEVLRVLLWDISEEFMLPEQHSYPRLFGPDQGGAWGFAMGLARAAVKEAQNFYPQMTFEDMFKVDMPVTRIWGSDEPGLWIEFQTPRKTDLADVVIVGMTSRAMQLMQLDLPYPFNPLVPSTLPSLTPDLVRPSCAAAIKRLNVVSGYRMNTELASPYRYEAWPEDAFGHDIICFVTDAGARLAYVLPEVPPDEGEVRVTAAEAYGADAHKFRAVRNPNARRRAVGASFAYGLQLDGEGGDGAAHLVGDLFTEMDENDINWSLQSRFQGAFKVDKPGDNYFSSSLFYHYQLAQSMDQYHGTDLFLSGDSVGHLGGWVEGAAMSAINAVVGVCRRLEQRFGTLTLADRFAALLQDDVNLFHRWTSMDGQAPSKAGLSSMVRLGNWEHDPALPPRWRYLGQPTRQAFTKVAVSKPGDFAVVVIDNQLFCKAPGSTWEDLRRVPGTDGFAPVQSISVASEKGNSEAQLLIVDKDGMLWHGTYQGGAWSEFRYPWGYARFRQAALDLEGGNAQVVLMDDQSRLAHGIRLANGEWPHFTYPPSPSGESSFKVWDVTASCTGIDQDLTTVAAIDTQTESVYVGVRDGRVPDWRPWVQLPSPRPPGAEEPLRAVKVRAVVLDDANHAQVWAQFSDGGATPAGLYTSARNTVDPSGQTWTRFQPVPYPLTGAAGRVVDFAATLPHGTVLNADLPELSSVVYAQLDANLDAEQPR